MPHTVAFTFPCACRTEMRCIQRFCIGSMPPPSPPPTPPLKRFIGARPSQSVLRVVLPGASGWATSNFIRLSWTNP
eukprot:7943955-Pyramimonas_sp.AAC.2